MKKLFVTDLDGTLLNSKKELPKNFPLLVEELKKDGSCLAFASGRSYKGLIDMFGSFSNDFGYICDNGGMVKYRDEILKLVTLTEQNLLDIQELRKIDPKLVLVFCGTKKFYLMNQEPLDAKQKKELDFYYTYCEKIQSVSEIHEGIIKAALLYMDDIKTNIAPFIHLDEALSFPVTAYCWIDIFRADLSKGEGIAALQEKLGIDREHTYVFGDYFNDLSMIDFAGTGFAMENAVPEVKEKYTRVIGSNEDGAVADEMLRILHGE